MCKRHTGYQINMIRKRNSPFHVAVIYTFLKFIRIYTYAYLGMTYILHVFVHICDYASACQCAYLSFMILVLVAFPVDVIKSVGKNYLMEKSFILANISSICQGSHRKKT